MLRTRIGQLYEPNEHDIIRLEEGGMYRASGDCICKECGNIYYKHCMIKGYEFLNRLCNGDFVKL